MNMTLPQATNKPHLQLTTNWLSSTTSVLLDLYDQIELQQEIQDARFPNRSIISSGANYYAPQNGPETAGIIPFLMQDPLLSSHITPTASIATGFECYEEEFLPRIPKSTVKLTVSFKYRKHTEIRLVGGSDILEE